MPDRYPNNSKINAMGAGWWVRGRAGAGRGRRSGVGDDLRLLTELRALIRPGAGRAGRGSPTGEALTAEPGARHPRGGGDVGCGARGTSPTSSVRSAAELEAFPDSPRPPDSCHVLGRGCAGQADIAARSAVSPLEARTRGRENGQQGDGERHTPRPTVHRQNQQAGRPATPPAPGQRTRPPPDPHMQQENLSGSCDASVRGSAARRWPWRPPPTCRRPPPEAVTSTPQPRTPDIPAATPTR